MIGDRLFLDTAFLVALLNPKDALHEKAKSNFDGVKKAREVWTTEAVLTEIGNAFGASRRSDAASFIERCFTTPTSRLSRAASRSCELKTSIISL